MITVLILSIYAWQRLRNIVRLGDKMTYRNHNLIIIADENIAPFSWCNNIVISENDYNQNGEMILAHECCHLESRHQIDLIIAQIFIILQWYNPTAWLMHREFSTIHEYQADMCVLRSHCNAHAYQLMLLKKAVSKQFPAFANSFNHSIIKKRITMMSNKKSSKFVKIGGLALLPAIALAIVVFNLPFVSSAMDSLADARIAERSDTQPKAIATTPTAGITENKVTENFSQPEAIAEEKSIENRHEAPQPASTAISSDVSCDKEELPQFPGGISELMHYLIINMKWPEEVTDADINTSSLVSFTVKADGSIANAKIASSSGYEALDNEAIRVVNSMPKWEPGQRDGIAVDVTYNLPIKFKSK